MFLEIKSSTGRPISRTQGCSLFHIFCVNINIVAISYLVYPKESIGKISKTIKLVLILLLGQLIQYIGEISVSRTVYHI